MSDLVTLHIDRTLHEKRAVAEIVLDSPSNRNALSRRFIRELSEALLGAASHPEVSVVLLRSSGKVFSSGADLSEALSVGMHDTSQDLVRLLAQIVCLPMPVVAQIDGPVRAGGLGIVAACDIAIASERATYCFNEARMGLAPAVISLTVLPQMSARTAELAILTSLVFDGPMAEAGGLISLTTPDRELPDAVHGILSDLLLAEPQGLAASKMLLRANIRQRIDDLGEEMASWSAELFSSKPARSALTQFLNA